ncbi:hypothetical protein ACSBR2_035127 [Camellia fascicularis]
MIVREKVQGASTTSFSESCKQISRTSLWDMAILLRNCELEGPMDDNPSNGDPMDDSPCEPPMLENSSKDLNALAVMYWNWSFGLDKKEMVLTVEAEKTASFFRFSSWWWGLKIMPKIDPRDIFRSFGANQECELETCDWNCILV